MSNQRNYIELHFIVALWGATAILGLLIEVPAPEVVFLRTAIASLALWIILKIKNINFAIGKDQVIRIVLTGGLFAIHWVLFFESARQANASVSLVGLSTCALWTALFEPIANKKRIKGFEVFLGLLIIVGLYVIFSFDFQYPLGLAMSVVAGIIAAVFTIINSRLAQKHSSYTITFYEMVGAAIVSAAIIPFYLSIGEMEAFVWPTLPDWGYLMILSIVCTVFAYTISVRLIKELTPYAFNLVVNMEPIYGMLLALVIFGDSEKMSTNFYYGSAIIISAIFIYPVRNRWKRRVR